MKNSKILCKRCFYDFIEFLEVFVLFDNEDWSIISYWNSDEEMSLRSSLNDTQFMLDESDLDVFWVWSHSLNYAHSSELSLIFLKLNEVKYFSGKVIFFQ